jgi:dTDP-4-amino-4,6-dideoxygalactose transaminase
MIPFSPPHIDDKIIAEVTEALKSGWITTGPRTKQLEKNLTAYCGNKSTVCLNSATAGLELVLRWFGVKEGDEVIIPSYTYCATANVVEHCGAKAVMVDVGKDFNISVEAIKNAITPKTKVIIPVDFSGFPCDYDEIYKVIEEKKSLFNAETEEQKQLGKILLLADAAHSIGAKYKGKMSGSLADISCFSFHAVKNLTTAEGGTISLNLPDSFNHDELYRMFCIKSLHGQSKDALAKSQKGAWKYDVIEAGYKCNMTDLQAAIGLVELERYNDILARRKSIFNQYDAAFSQYDFFELPFSKTDEKESSYHVYALRVKGIAEAQRDEIIQKIFDKDVSVNVHFQPLPLLSYYKNKGYNINNFPNAYDNFSREISLPVYYDLDESNVKTVIDAVIQSVQEVINA